MRVQPDHDPRVRRLRELGALLRERRVGQELLHVDERLHRDRDELLQLGGTAVRVEGLVGEDDREERRPLVAKARVDHDPLAAGSPIDLPMRPAPTGPNSTRVKRGRRDPVDGARGDRSEQRDEGRPQRRVGNALDQVGILEAGSDPVDEERVPGSHQCLGLAQELRVRGARPCRGRERLRLGGSTGPDHVLVEEADRPGGEQAARGRGDRLGRRLGSLRPVSSGAFAPQPAARTSDTTRSGKPGRVTRPTVASSRTTERGMTQAGRAATMASMRRRYADDYRGWPVAPRTRQHPVRGSFLDPRAGALGYHHGIDISVRDDRPVAGAPSGRTHRVYALEGGPVRQALSGLGPWEERSRASARRPTPCRR